LKGCDRDGSELGQSKSSKGPIVSTQNRGRGFEGDEKSNKLSLLCDFFDIASEAYDNHDEFMRCKARHHPTEIGEWRKTAQLRAFCVLLCLVQLVSKTTRK